MSVVTWRGKKFDPQTREMLIEVDKLVGPDVQIKPTQGSYSSGVAASGGTHSGGGAVDLSVAALSPTQIDIVVFLLRRVGFAAWHRSPSEGPWGAHIHAIDKTAADLSPQARSQVVAYGNGKNGLANGRADKHKALRAPVSATWQSYTANWPGR